MQRYNFNNLLSDLEIGREIEFTFEGTVYGITNGNGHWYFCCENSEGIELSKFEDYEGLVESLKDRELIKMDLEDIFNCERYKSLYIL